MIEQKSENILFELDGAFIHDPMPGFGLDYICMHSLLRKYKPKTVFEIGTCWGNGVNVIATALPDAKIYSLDLPYENKELSKQYPLGENGEDLLGGDAKFPYTQLRGDSMNFNYWDYPCEGYFVDGEHTLKNVFHETLELLHLFPKIIIFHDANMPEVMQGITDAWRTSTGYQLYRIVDTRISYLLKNTNEQ